MKTRTAEPEFGIRAWLIWKVLPWARLELYRAEARRDAAACEALAISRTIAGIVSLLSPAGKDEA